MKITLPRDPQGFKQRNILVQDERMLFRKWHKTDTPGRNNGFETKLTTGFILGKTSVYLIYVPADRTNHIQLKHTRELQPPL